jgi:hypothetical protein
VTLRTVLRKSWEWIFRSAALRKARAGVVDSGASRGRASRQARLLLEVARRVAEPVERFPPGSRTAVLLSLYRDAAYWALVATGPDDGGAPSDLGTLWAEYPPDALLRAASDPASLDAIKRSFDVSPSGALETAPEDATRARAFVQALLGELEGPRRRVERVLLQRWTRLMLIPVAVLALALGIRQLTLGPNLAAKKPFRTSSSWPGCASDPGCMAQLFHTEPQNHPWVEFDLLKPTKIQRIEVTNRSDCCSERAVPLVAEVGMDQVNWTPISRRDADFSSWTINFPPRTARYVRLRVAGHSTFHLKDVAIR